MNSSISGCCFDSKFSGVSLAFFLMKAFYLSVALTAIVLAGCSKNDDTKTGTIAGAGGPASIRVSLVRDGVPVDSGRVRIRYNASSAPSNPYGWNDSADVVRFESSPAQALFPRLRRGQYFIDATGYLPLTAFNNPRIATGSVAYLLTDSTAVNVVIPLDKLVP